MDSIFKLAAVYSVVDKLTGPVKKMAGTVTNFEKLMNKANGISNFGMKMGAMSAIMAESGNKMKGMMQSLIEPYAQIEDASAALKTVTITTMGDVNKSIKTTQQAAIEWSKTHTDAADKFIQTSYMMASAGLNDVQAIEATKTAMTVAKATMGDSGEAAELIATLYNNMGDKTKEAGAEMSRLGDILTKTQQTFQFKNLGQLTEGLKYATPTALQFRMSVEEVNTVIGQLNNAGVTGSMAGTAFSAAMRQMNKASAELGFEIARTSDGGVSFIKTIENIKNKFGDFSNMTAAQQEAFKKAFGDEGLRTISLLMNKTGDMNKALQSVTNSSGEAAKAQATMEDTVHARAIIAANKLTALKAAFGEKILGNKKVVDEVIPKFQQVVEKIGNMVLAFTEAHPQIAANGIALFAFGSGLLLLIAPILSVGSAFIMMAGTGLKGVVKLGQGVKWLYLTLMSGRAKAYLTTLRIKFVSTFTAGRAAVIRAVTALQTFIRSLWRTSAAAATSAGQGIKRMTVSLAGMARQAAITAATGLRSLIVSLGRVSREAAIAALQGIRAMTTAMLGMARQAIITAVTALVPLIAAVWSFTAALLANPITWIVIAVMALGAVIWWLIRNWNNLSGTMQTVIAIIFPLGALIAWLANNWDIVAAAAQNAWSVTVAAFQNGLVWIQEAINSAVLWITSMMDTFFISGAALWEAFTNGIKSAVSGPVEAVKAGLQRIRNMLPFSDAREGPLSQLTHNGSKLMTTIAEGVNQGAPELHKAVRQSFRSLETPMLPEKMQPFSKLDVPSQDESGFLNSFKNADKFTLAGFLNNQITTNRLEDAEAQPVYHFHFGAGAITVKADNMDSTDSVLSVFKQLATEVGAD